MLAYSCCRHLRSLRDQAACGCRCPVSFVRMGLMVVITSFVAPYRSWQQLCCHTWRTMVIWSRRRVASQWSARLNRLQCISRTVYHMNESCHELSVL